MKIHKMHKLILNLMSYNAVLNFIIDNRNTGKTTQFKKRALIRAINNHTMTVWCRRFEKEIIKFKKEFLNKKFFAVLKEDFGNKFNKEDFKIKGDYAFYKNIPFVYFLNLQCAKSDKGVDNENIDTIVFDEFMTEEIRYNYYKGNEVHDFFTIFFTKKRTHADGTQSHVKIFMLGNRDSFTNPYYTYFGLPTLPIEFEGIKTFSDGSIAVMQLNNEEEKDTSLYGKKLTALLKDTPLDAYLHGNVINNIDMKFYNAPKNCQLYAQFDCGYNISLVNSNGFLYALKRSDKNKIMFVDKPNDKYKKCYVINKSKKSIFAYLDNCYKRNLIKYENQRVYYETMKVLAIIGIV